MTEECAQPFEKFINPMILQRVFQPGRRHHSQPKWLTVELSSRDNCYSVLYFRQHVIGASYNFNYGQIPRSIVSLNLPDHHPSGAAEEELAIATWRSRHQLPNVVNFTLQCGVRNVPRNKVVRRPRPGGVISARTCADGPMMRAKPSSRGPIRSLSARGRRARP